MIEGNSKIWNEAVSKEKTLNIHLFPGKTGESFSFDYVDNTDSNKEKPLVISTASNQIQFTSPALSVNVKLICRLEKQPSAVMLNGKNAECEWNMANNILMIFLCNRLFHIEHLRISQIIDSLFRNLAIHTISIGTRTSAKMVYR